MEQSKQPPPGGFMDPVLMDQMESLAPSDHPLFAGTKEEREAADLAAAQRWMAAQAEVLAELDALPIEAYLLAVGEGITERVQERLRQQDEAAGLT